MTTVILILLGLFIGGAVAEEEGVVFGFFIGLAFGMIATLKGRIFKLEQELAQTIRLLDTSTSPKQQAADIEAQVEPEPVAATVTPAVANKAELVAEVAQAKPIETSWNDSSWQDSSTATPSGPDFAEKLTSKLKAFFTEGNVVVKVGAIVLFFGVAFLLKYASERSLFPIELRLLSVIAAGVGVLIVGWRLRNEKLEYGLILQGAGLGLLYLTVFASSKFYQVVPTSFSMGVMLLLVVLTGVLAVQQNAKSLALFGVVGGFLAPILMSTGTGSHIALFSYYAFLNAGIFGIAWFKSWRFLNFVGFIFTFAISAAWGYDAYRPEFFVSTESFLILFYFLYLTISILFAFRQAPKLKGYVDGTLVFGLPLIVFALQSQLVEPFEFGQAISAVVMSALYLCLAKLLWQPEKNGLRLLAESFLALGVTFGSLAIPLYFDGRWTAAVWSLEGAALVWVGLRQSHLIPRLFGLLLSIGAGLIFIESIEVRLAGSMAVFNSAYLGMVLVSLSALFITYLYDHYQQISYKWELKIPMVMVVWGLLWWFMAGFIEIERYVPVHYELKIAVLFIALTTFLQAVASYTLAWTRVFVSSILFTPVSLLLLLTIGADDLLFRDATINPMANLGFIVWPAALLVHLLVLRRKEYCWSSNIIELWHSAGVWLVGFIAIWAIADGLDSIASLNDTWVMSFIGLSISLLIGAVIRWGNEITWPISLYQRAYYLWGLAPIVLSLLIWLLISVHFNADPSPLDYIPILNPLDMMALLTVFVLVVWSRFITPWITISRDIIVGVLAIIGLVLINVIIARTVHHFTGVMYSDYAMLHSGVFQTSASIVWSLVAMVLMALAYKKASRYFWFAGAGLLALVVLKLFFVDLADSGSISRIVSFLAVGALMLVIGYFSPLPPKSEITN